MSTSVRVLIADDHAATRGDVRATLERAGFEIVSDAASADAAVEAAIAHRPDVCLLDIHMPGNGIHAAARIADELPEAAIVMLTVSRNDDDLFDALRVGATGYLLKGLDLERLPEELVKILEGEAVLPGTLVARLVDEFRDRSRRRFVRLPKRKGVELTSREWQVLDLMRKGLTTAEMAERLFVSKVTIRSHVAAILKKMRVPDRRAAVRLIEGRDDV